jgi:integrase
MRLASFHPKEGGESRCVFSEEKARRKTEKLAQLAKAKRTVEIAEGKLFGVRRKPKLSFAEAVGKYMEWAKGNKISWLRDQQSLAHWQIELGRKLLSQVSRLDVERYKLKRKEEAAPRTVNEELSCLKRLCYRLMEQGLAENNPVKGVKFLRQPPGRIRTLSSEEMERLIEACPEHIRPIVITALNTGMRQGEIFGLQWQDVDFSRNVIVVRNSKNGERREIPMTATLCRVLVELQRHAEEKRRRKPAATQPPIGNVFMTPDGMPYGGGRSIRESFVRATKKAGLVDLRFHDLRHVFASNLRMRGADLLDIKEYLGHKSLAMTARYAHITTERRQEVIQLLDCSSEKMERKREKAVSPVKEKNG